MPARRPWRPWRARAGDPRSTTVTPVPRRGVRLANRALGVLAAATLALDAYVHATDAGFYDGNRAAISQGDLFRVEAAAASLLALLVLLWPHRASWAGAFLVATSALGAVLLYRYVDVGILGPLPDMYEPTWTVPGKALSASAEAVAAFLSSTGLLLTGVTHHLHRQALEHAHRTRRTCPTARRSAE